MSDAQIVASMNIDAQDTLLFSYGTLQQENVQLALFGRRLSGIPDILPEYVVSMIEITDPDVLRTSGKKFYPAVVATNNLGDEVAGVIFSITAAELAAADAYEGPNYKRVLVALKSGDKAWVYAKT